MELNFKSARKISLSIWITHLTLTVVSLIWFIVIFTTLMKEFIYWPSNHYEMNEFLDAVSELTVGINIMTVSISFIMLILSIWLFTFVKTLPDGRAKKLIMLTLIFYFVVTPYNILISFLSIFINLPMFLNMFNSIFGGLSIAAWIMMIISSNYLNHFEISNAPKMPFQQMPMQWNPNMQYPGQQQNPWVQPPQQNPQPEINDPISKIEQANKLKEKGLITEEEFQKIKNDALDKL